MKSIRSYLLTRLLSGAVIVLAAAGAGVYLIVARSLESQFDRNLAEQVQGLASLVFQVRNVVEFEFSDELMPAFGEVERPQYFELWLADGRLIERSDSLVDGDLELRAEPGAQPSFWTAPLPDGRPGRYVTQLTEIHHVHPEEGPERPTPARIVLALARGRGELLAAQRVVLWQCTAASLALILLLALLSWRAVERGLEPAKRLAAVLDGIEIQRLPERLEIGALPSELVPVREKTDALIRRAGAALQRERRTTADIAHELRTPISEMLTVSEVALRNGSDAPATLRALGTARDVAWRMGRSVSTLLQLARLEMGTQDVENGSVDLEGIVREQLRSLASLEHERELRIEEDLAAGARVEGSREVLEIIVANLLSNALYYCPLRGHVACRIEGGGKSWRLVIENDAGDLVADDLEVLGQPFWRKQGQRTSGDRSGLGLALSCALAQKTGTELAFELAAGRFRAYLKRSVT